MPGMAFMRANREVGALAQRRAKRLLVAAVAEQRRRDRVLRRPVAAQPTVRQLLDRGQQLVQPRIPADHHPAGAPPRSEIRLREARERDDRGIRREAAHRRHGTVVREVAVDLVGQQHETVPLGHVDERAPRGVGIHRAGRIVRVDDDQRARARGDERFEVVEIGLPAVRRVRPVIARVRADLREHGGVERIRRHRHEHRVAWIDQRGQRQLDPFRGAGSDEHAIRVGGESLSASSRRPRLRAPG